jgi:hypothetical protein
MTDRYRAVVFDYTQADLELFDAIAKAKARRPPPRQKPIRRRKKKQTPQPPPHPPMTITNQGRPGMVRSWRDRRRINGCSTIRE